MTEVAPYIVDVPTLGYELKVAPELKDFVRPISDIKPHPDNPRTHRIEKIAQSLQTHGQRALVIVQASTGYIVKGNGTYDAARLLGWNALAMSKQDMSDAMALAFLYADNRASDLASYERKLLHKGLKKLVDGPGLMDTLWEADEFADLDEEQRGLAAMSETGEDDDLADADDSEAVAPQKPAEKMREVPMVFTATEHAMFVEWLGVLKRSFGISGAQATIYEALRRQAELETSGAAITGKSLDDNSKALAVAEWAHEFRAVLNGLPIDIPSRSKVLATMDSMLPKLEKPVPVVAPGQATMEDAVPDPSNPETWDKQPTVDEFPF
jgi:hypothetical protein